MGEKKLCGMCLNFFELRVGEFNVVVRDNRVYDSLHVVGWCYKRKRIVLSGMKACKHFKKPELKEAEKSEE